MTFAPSPEQLTGTIAGVLSHDIITGVENDGDHTYLNIQQECKTQLPVTAESMNITIPLTNPNVDVVCFDKSFITMTVAVTFDLSTAPTLTSADPIGGAVKYFIGLKHSSECLLEYSVYHNGKQVSNTLQSNATAESFLYHVYRSKESLSNRRGIYTIAEAAAKGDTSSVCGRFITLYELKGLTSVTIPFTITIPFNDILCFQQFLDFPSALFGQMELRFKFNKNAFVVLQCDPKVTLKQYMDNYPSDTNLTTLKNAYNTTDVSNAFNHEFAQIGDPSRMITQISYASNAVTYTIANQTITPGNISINECFSTICGYRISPATIEDIRATYQSKPWVKFSQSVNFLPFSSGPSASQLYITQQTYLNNTTDFIVTFPRTQHEVTVLKNPMLTDLSLTVMNRKYPEMALDTDSERFAQIMITSSDTFNETPNREYVQSVSVARADANGSITPAEDLTSFVCTLKVERPSAMGMVCDGLDSNGQQVSVRLSAKPKYTNNTEYCGQNVPPPVLYTVNDSFFIFNAIDGGQCIYSDKDFNEVLANFM